MCPKAIDLCEGWRVLQDVHDLGEKLGLFRFDWDPYEIGPAMSPWQAIPRLAHLQLIFARQPYFGRELRYFNEHPWWYRLEFETPQEVRSGATLRAGATLRFEGVDYYASIWLNEQLLGDHEGYFEPFEFEVGPLLRHEGPNLLVVKVSSPWDIEVAEGREHRRAYLIIRNMLKGTYEHADTFIQRDVNPVGIWRPVKLGLHKGLRSAERAAIDTSVTENSSARVSVSWPVILDDERGKADFTVRILSDACGTTAAHVSKRVDLGPGRSDLSASVSLDSPKLWSTWDRGEPNLYRAELCVQAPGMAPLRASETFGIRTVELRRSDRETTFLLNGRPIFLRGTNYFPDAYLSALDRSRYERDLSAIVRAGMNAVRVHVHVENEEFYELCDRMGLVVMQDSDLNWLYPTSESFCRRAVSVFEAMIKKLRNHPSVICWVCQNEPHGRAESRMHKLRPGPQLQEAATRLTPSHPVIRSSDVDDPHSGDSHNYTGSLNGHDSHYTDILGAEEKLNTEFGFDAPPSAEQVRQVPEITERLARVLPHVAELHNYQYRLTKHYIEHYRVQKYDPCSGYFQFMWIDLCPQSFYGIYDWWGLPKAEGLGGGLRALKESNMPVAVFLANEQRPVTLWVVNDTLDDLGECSLDWLVKGDDDTIAGSGETAVRIDPDSRVRAGDLALPLSPEDCREVTLTLRDPNGTVLAWNLYTDPFKHPPHPEGHPHRVDHEIGIRLYWGG